MKIVPKNKYDTKHNVMLGAGCTTTDVKKKEDKDRNQSILNVPTNDEHDKNTKQKLQTFVNFKFK